MKEAFNIIADVLIPMSEKECPSEPTTEGENRYDASLKLDKKRWDSFVATLDEPPRNIPALRELLTNASVFDEK